MVEKKKSFIKSAAILTAAGVLGKILGAVYRIPFNRIVGEEGAALYALGYSLYMILFALSTAGIPLAVSKMVAVSEERRDYGESLRLLKITFCLMTGIGLTFACIVYFGSDWIATNLFHEPRAALSLKCLAPAMLFSCLMAVFRGYFQGKQNMVPTAISQVLEQFFRVSTIFVAIYLLRHAQMEVTVAGATFGSAMGGIMGFSFLALYFIAHRRRIGQGEHEFISGISEKKPASKVIGQLLYFTIPICIGALVLPIVQFIDSTLVMPRLMSIGYSPHDALVQQGYLTSYALPIIGLPFIITTAVAASLVPAIAENYEQKDMHSLNRNVYSALLLTMIIMLPASMGITVLGKPIIQLLFAHKTAGVALSYVGFTVLFVGIYQVSAGVLQGLGKVLVPMASLIIGAIIKLTLTWALTASSLGIRGAALSTVIAFAVASIFNLSVLSRIIGIGWLDLKMHLVKPLVSALSMAAIVYFLYRFCESHIGNTLATGISIIIGGSAYFIILFFLGGINAEALEKVPKVGHRLAKIIKK